MLSSVQPNIAFNCVMVGRSRPPESPPLSAGHAPIRERPPPCTLPETNCRILLDHRPPVFTRDESKVARWRGFNRAGQRLKDWRLDDDAILLGLDPEDAVDVLTAESNRVAPAKASVKQKIERKPLACSDWPARTRTSSSSSSVQTWKPSVLTFRSFTSCVGSTLATRIFAHRKSPRMDLRKLFA